MSFHSVKKITITYKEYIDIKSMPDAIYFRPIQLISSLYLDSRSRQYGIPQ